MNINILEENQINVYTPLTRGNSMFVFYFNLRLTTETNRLKYVENFMLYK